MKNTKTVTLEEICEKGSSSIAQNEIENNFGTYPIYGAAGFIKNVDFYKSDKPYIGIVKDGAGVGRVSIHPEMSSLIGTMQYIFPNENVDINYLAEFLKSQNLGRFYTGATIPHIYFKDYKSIKLNLPSLENQRYIAEKFCKCHEIIKKHKLLLDKYDILIKSRFIEMFGDPVKNEKGWEISELGKQCSEVRYGTSKPAVENGKYPYLRMNNITYEGQLDLNNLKYIDIPDTELQKCQVRKGDILFNRTNSIDLCGKTCLFNLDIPMIIAGYIIRVRLNEKLNPHYVSTFFNTKSIKKLLREMAKGAVNQANINAQEMQAIQIPVPPIELQNDFASFVQQIDKSKFAVQKSLEKAEILYKSLMQEYFG
ncbi:MAG: restriction endonuclease subunit S [Spirochaetaceae bacterium]|nr:restriction endonuclease subunit S [Spirochaetaceae bacterium]